MKIHLQYVDAFTDTPGAGNRAGVVLDARGLSTEAMQAIAARAQAPETAFGLPSTDPETHDLEVRYFSPTREVPICGHATIGFHSLRAQAECLSDRTIRVKTGAGILPVQWRRDGQKLRVEMTQGQPTVLSTPEPLLVARALNALGLEPADLEPGLPIEVVTTGHAKVLIPIRKLAKLDALRPTREALIALSEVIGATGYFVFTREQRDPQALYHGRMFAPASGVDEDPVTGNANGPAGFYLHRHRRLPAATDGVIRYFAVQGEAMGRPGKIEVLLDVADGEVTRVRIAGGAVLAPEESFFEPMERENA